MKPQTTTFVNGQQVHCPVCAHPLWTEAHIDVCGVVTRKLTETSMAHLKAHDEGHGCTCRYVPGKDAYVAPFRTNCDHHHGYECVWCKAPITSIHCHVYVRVQK